MADKMYS